MLIKTNDYDRLTSMNLGVGNDENGRVAIVFELNKKIYLLEPSQVANIIGALTQTLEVATGNMITSNSKVMDN